MLIREMIVCFLGASPSGKARDFDSRIRRFESCRPCQFDPLAQSAEHLPFKQGVRSSNLRRVTNLLLTTKWVLYKDTIEKSCAKDAGVAELVDAPHSKCGGATRAGSSPATGTNRNFDPNLFHSAGKGSVSFLF